MQPRPSAPVPFSGHVSDDAGERLVRIAGEVDIAVREEFDTALRAACTGVARDVTVDLSEVTFMDAGALNVIVAQSNRLTSEHGRRLVIRGASGVVRRMFVLTGCAELLDDEPPTGGAAGNPE